jgi:hypothetical protein
MNDFRAGIIAMIFGGCGLTLALVFTGDPLGALPKIIPLLCLCAVIAKIGVDKSNSLKKKLDDAKREKRPKPSDDESLDDILSSLRRILNDDETGQNDAPEKQAGRDDDPVERLRAAADRLFPKDEDVAMALRSALVSIDAMTKPLDETAHGDALPRALRRAAEIVASFEAIKAQPALSDEENESLERVRKTLLRLPELAENHLRARRKGSLDRLEAEAEALEAISLGLELPTRHSGVPRT